VNKELFLGCFLYALGQTFVWFEINSQFVWKWWEGKPLFSVLVLGIPAGLCFWFATKYSFQAMEEIWGPRFLAFGMSYITFPILAWWFMKESMFTERTMICVFLSFLIMAVQFYGRNDMPTIDTCKKVVISKGKAETPPQEEKNVTCSL